jgi:hypothetical protein
MDGMDGMDGMGRIDGMDGMEGMGRIDGKGEPGDVLGCRTRSWASMWLRTRSLSGVSHSKDRWMGSLASKSVQYQLEMQCSDHFLGGLSDSFWE